MIARSLRPTYATAVPSIALCSIIASSARCATALTTSPRSLNCLAASCSCTVPCRVRSRKDRKALCLDIPWIASAHSSAPRTFRCAQMATWSAASRAANAQAAAFAELAPSSVFITFPDVVPPPPSFSPVEALQPCDTPCPSRRCFNTDVYACWIAWKRRVFPMPALSGCSFRDRLRYARLIKSSDTSGPSSPRMKYESRSSASLLICFNSSRCLTKRTTYSSMDLFWLRSASRLICCDSASKSVSALPNS
mmetsp:Transcript_110221/g.218972  ORF Transcript_110221/g.218972 Transcript_110221/m.218972 type:complete len:251 (-) Transcript_110221:805-1557(-)